MIRGAPSLRPSSKGSASDLKASRGQSLVEFALLLPFLVVVTLLAVDIGRAYLGSISLSNIARIGANFAAQNPDAWDGAGNAAVQARYQSLMTRDATGIGCTLDSPLPAPIFDGSGIGTEVHVELDCAFEAITPGLNELLDMMKSDRPATQFDDADKDKKVNLTLSASAVFTIRTGSVDGVTINGEAVTPTPSASAAPTPTATPTDTPTATPTADPGATPTPFGETPAPTAAPTPTTEPRIVTFYGSSTSSDASGGGPPGSVDEDQIVGIVTLNVLFVDTSTGPPKSACLWNFGDGVTETSCGNQFSHTYTSRGTFTVTLTIDGVTYSRANYVLVGCKVPAFAGVHKSSAVTNWTNAGFSSGNMSYLPGNGNYKIGYQSLAGGLVNPMGGCSGATITVGP